MVDLFVKVYSWIPSHKEDDGILYFYDLFEVELDRIISGKENIIKYYRSRNMTERADSVKHSFLYLMGYKPSPKMGKVTREEFYRETDREEIKFE